MRSKMISRSASKPIAILSLALSLVACTGLSSGGADARLPAQEDLVLWDRASLERSLAAIEAGSPRALRARDAVLREAARSMELEVRPVTSGKTAAKYIAPTGDKRDYVSLSPYWWPNPDTADGFPYVRRDGEINPDRPKYDADKLRDLGFAVTNLALGYLVSGDERFAKRATEHLQAWFLDEETRMHPHFTFGQFRPGHTKRSHGGIIEALRIRWLPDATGLLLASPHWTRDKHERVQQWFSELLDWMRTSELGKKESKSQNNHGTWYASQAVRFATYSKRENVAREMIAPIFERIAKQIESDGSQAHEMKRTRSLGYHDFNIRALLDIARLAQNFDIDVLRYETPDGRGIRRALEFCLPRMTDLSKWPGKQIVPPRRHNQFQMYRIASRLFGDERYEAEARKLQPKADEHAWMDIALPPLRFDD